MPAGYTIQAKNAILYTNAEDYVGTIGVAMCTPERRVFFQADTTGLWTELFDTDIARLQLLGDRNLILEAALQDGDIVLKASRTVQRRAA